MVSQQTAKAAGSTIHFLTMHEEINGNNMRITRGIYIEDTLYVIQGNIIEAYSLKDFKKVDDIIL